MQKLQVTTTKGNDIIFVVEDGASVERAMVEALVDMVYDLKKELEDIKANKSSNNGTGVYNININLPKGE